jgi:hypothetical protein
LAARLALRLLARIFKLDLAGEVICYSDRSQGNIAPNNYIRAPQPPSLHCDAVFSGCRQGLLPKVIFLPGQFANWRLITASTINLFLDRYADAPIINPDIIGIAACSKDSIQAASHIPSPAKAPDAIGCDGLTLGFSRHRFSSAQSR